MKKVAIVLSILALSGCSFLDMIDTEKKMKVAAAQKAAAEQAAAQKAAAERAAAQRAAAEQAAAQKAAAERAAAQKAAAEQAAAQKAAAEQAAAQRAAPRVLTEAEQFQEVVNQLANQLNRNMGRRTGQKFIVTSFTALDRISEGSDLGQMLSESLINQLQIRGWDLVELRLTDTVSVNKAGEFGLSREHRRLKEQFQANGIITGTFSVAGQNILLNARVMNYESGAVVSSAQVRLPMTGMVEELTYSKKNQMSLINISGGMGPR
jgi:TolB-like protein